MPSDDPAQRRLGVLAHQLQPQAATEAASNDALRHDAATAPTVVIGGIVMDVQVSAMQRCTHSGKQPEQRPVKQAPLHLFKSDCRWQCLHAARPAATGDHTERRAAGAA